MSGHDSIRALSKQPCAPSISASFTEMGGKRCPCFLAGSIVVQVVPQNQRGLWPPRLLLGRLEQIEAFFYGFLSPEITHLFAVAPLRMRGSMYIGQEPKLKMKTSGESALKSKYKPERAGMRFRLALLTLFLLCVASLPALAQHDWGRPHPPQSGACFYRDSGFRGDYFCLRDGERWPSMPPGFNDRISSIRVFGGARLRVFADDNFGGISGMIDHDVFDLSSFRLPDNPYKNWNDRISSIAVFREHDQWERHDRDQPPPPPYHEQPPYQGQQPRQGPPEAGACFYLDAKFRGDYFCMKEGERLPVPPPGFNDSISSIRVFGGVRVRVFNDGNFGNISLVIDRDVSNLQGIPLADNPFKNWNDRISSIVVFRDHDDWERHDRDQGPPRY